MSVIDFPPRERTFDLRGFGRQLMIVLIENAATPSEMKERIMVARQYGHLSDAEAEDWIAVAGLKHE